MKIDDRYVLTAEELREFVAPAIAYLGGDPGPIRPARWMLRGDGSTYVDFDDPDHADYAGGFPMPMLSGPDPAWCAQWLVPASELWEPGRLDAAIESVPDVTDAEWDAPLQRACDEQLNPLLAQAFGKHPDIEEAS